MYKYTYAASLVLLALTGLFPSVQAQNSTLASPIPSKLAQLSFFEGAWRCTGKIKYCGTASECVTTGTTHIEKAIGDSWLHVIGDETVEGDAPQTFHFALYLGYDPKLKSFVSLGVGGPGIYGTQYSNGWSGDTFVLSQDKYLARDTFVKKSESEFNHTGDWRGKDKRWTNVQ